MKLILFFLPLVVSLLPSWDVILAKQKKISQIIDKTLKEIKIPYSKRHIVENESYIQNFCPNDIYHNMSACCSAQELFNLYNVKIEKGKFIGYSSTPHRPIHLPTIASLQYNAKPTYTNTFTIRNGSFGHQQCSKYFNGTLHITGEQTVHKLYHAITDNYIPLVSHILMDAWLNPEYLHLPRMVLRIHPKANNEVKQMKLYYDILSGGIFTVMEVEGWCFRRVLWGDGAHVYRHINSIAQRRITAKFTRAHIQLMYPSTPFHFDPSNPLPIEDLIGQKYPSFSSLFRFQSASKLGIQVAEFTKNSGHPPRVVLYSRGESGLGRTMAKETLLLEFLRHVGMETHYFCDNCGNMESQIAFASAADVIIGLHGAALVYTLFGKENVITLEMKTVYAYESYLFPLVSDGVRGIHALVDTREYHSPFAGQSLTPGMRAIAEIDALLLNRIVDTLTESFELLKSQNHSRVLRVSESHEDYVFGYSSLHDPGNRDMNHVLGPLDGSQPSCLKLPLVQIQKILTKKNSTNVCRDCSLFHQPIFSRRLIANNLRDLEVD